MSNSKSPNKSPLPTPKGRLPSLAKRRELAREILQRLGKDRPEAKTELVFHTPYQLLVSVILSAQTTDKMVNRCMEPLYAEGFGPQDVLQLKAEGLLTKIRTIGLAPTKSRNVFAMTQMLVERHGGEVPQTREELEALPGVGRKTASVILGELFGQPTIAVDTHVFRVGRRLNFHRENTAEKAEVELLKVIDPKLLPEAHHWLILHGRYVCKAQRPLCDQCAVASQCSMPKSNLAPSSK